MVPGGTRSKREGHVVSWWDVTVELAANRGGRRILRGVSGVAGPASAAVTAAPSAFAGSSTETLRGGGGGGGAAGVFAILGPSGAGKTTLLDVLAGRPSPGHVVGGEIRVDGALVDGAGMRRVSGYVPQDDVLPGTSTVWEHLTFHGALRLPGDVSRRRLRAVVWRTMQDFGIDGIAHSFIGDEFTRGLSGGEKRRVSIAAELLTSPGIMFLDEPTTGLDSSNAAKVVDILAALGRVGVTVVMSIHQPRPDIFRLLDRVLVMSGTGRAVYSGPSAAAEAHFASLPYAPRRPDDVHVADYVLDTVLRSSEEDVARMTDDFDGSSAAAYDAVVVETLVARASRRGGAGPGAETPAFGSGDVASMPRKYRASFGAQVRTLWSRMARNVRRHPFLITLRFVATGAAALSIGAIFWNAGRDTGGIQNRMGSMFFMLLYLTLMSLSSLPVWREDRLLFLRERASGAYGTRAYFTSVVCFDILVLRVAPPLFFSLVAYPMVGLRWSWDDPITSTWCVLWFSAVMVLTNIAASALCMAIGIVSPTNAVANACGLLALLTSVLCGGFLLNAQGDNRGPNWATEALTRASFVNYAFDALLINEFLDAGTFQFTPKWNDANGKTRSQISVDVTGKEVLQFFSFGDTTAIMFADLTALCAIAVAYLALAFLLLQQTVRRLGVD